MPTIDAQVHAYERNHPGRPWAGVLHGPAEVTGEQMVAAMDAVGVDGAVLVSPFTMYGYDASYALEVYRPGGTVRRPAHAADPGGVRQRGGENQRRLHAVARPVPLPGPLGAAGAHLRRLRP